VLAALRGLSIALLLVASLPAQGEGERVLRFGLTADYPPFALHDAAGRLTGADVEAARRLAATLGRDAEFVETTWTTLSADFRAGRFDILIGGITVTPERAALGTYSRILMRDGKRPLVRCGDERRFTTPASFDRRFLDQQHAGGHVPRRQAHLPEAVETAGGHVGQVERGGARAADAGGLLGELLEHRQVGVDVVELAEGEAGADQRLVEAGAARHADAAVVEEGAAAARGGEQLVGVGIETTACSSTPFLVCAIETAYCGKPWMKLVVPSSGSMIQVNSLSWPPGRSRRTPLLESRGSGRRRAAPR
jgi:ABC-type amino acid transport substrate-binding protein